MDTLEYRWPLDDTEHILPTISQWGEFGPSPEGIGPRPDFEMHEGIDLPAEEGEPVRVAAAGVVTLVFVDGEGDEGAGNSVWVKHSDGLQTRYHHMRDVPLVRQGDVLELGDVIGYVGETGRATWPHLCFQTIFYGEAHNPRQFMRNRARDYAARLESESTNPAQEAENGR